MHLQRYAVKNFSGGACPRTPLAEVRIHKSRLGTPLITRIFVENLVKKA